MQRSQIFTLEGLDPTTLAKGNTKLEDIAQFYDANGVFALANPQELTITGNAKTSTLYVDGQMTLDQLAAGIQNAIGTAGGLGISNSSVGVVTTASTNVAGMGGYIEFVSGSIGDAGTIGFAADQSLLNALGMSETRAARNNQVEVELTNASGETRKIRTESNRLSGLLNGVDLVYESQAAQIAGTKGIEQGLEVDAAIQFTLTADNGTTDTVNIVTGYWTMEGLARSINAQLTNLDPDGMEATVVDGQIRLSYEPADPTDSSDFTISGVGDPSNAIGIINKSVTGFFTGEKDVSKQVEGFSTFGATTNNIQVSLNDGAGGATAVTLYTETNVASAADMLQASTFLNAVNTALDGSEEIRADVVGNTIVFTNKRVGRENNDGAAPSESIVELSNVATAAVDLFGLEAGTSKGTGDKNFRIHVINNDSQFQIGADRGQVMKVSMGNMSAEALGVDNIDLTSIEGANKALGKINQAIDKVSAERSKLGAFQNRLEYAINNLRSTHSNLTSAESRIRDADIAMEMIEFTRNQIVSQSGTAMLAQANLVPQGVLQLLR